MSPRRYAPWLVLAVLIAAAQGALPQGTTTLPAGALVVEADADFTPTLIATALAIGLCHIDADGGSDYDAGETLLLDVDSATCATNTEVNDVRLSASGSFAAGTTIRTVDSDFNLPVRDLAAGGATDDDILFYDANGNGFFDLQDTMYVDIISPANDRVDVGDLRLTRHGSTPAGVVVAGASDTNLGLRELPTARDVEDANVMTYFDRNANAVFDHGDTMYLDPDGPSIIPLIGFDVPVTADVRITPWGALGFGTIVGLDPDRVPVYIVAGQTGVITGNLCSIDEDGGNDYDAGEPLIFDVDAACTTNTEANDIRLTASSGRNASTLIRTTDPDHNRPVLSQAANDNLEYYDGSGNGFFNKGDTLYVDLVADSSNRVDVGDLRLTWHGQLPALATVRAGDADVNLGLTTSNLPAGLETADANVLAFLDAQADSAFNPGDFAYLNMNAGAFPEFVQVNDVRLMAISEQLLWGTITGPNDPEVVQALTALTTVSLCAIDEDGGGDYDAGEPLVLDRSTATCDGATTAAGDVRLTNSAQNVGGSIVATADTDFNRPLEGTGLGDTLEMYDADGNGLLSANDTLYVDIISNANNRVDVGDLRLTRHGSLPGLTAVKAGDADVNLGLNTDLNGGAANPASGWDISAQANLLGFYDVDGDNVLTRGDAVYVNVDAAAPSIIAVQLFDVRVTPLANVPVAAPPAPPGPPPPTPPGNVTPPSPPPAEPPTAPPTTPPTTPTTPPSTPPSTPPGPATPPGPTPAPAPPPAAPPPPPPEAERPTPGFGALLVLGALGAALGLARRRA